MSRKTQGAYIACLEHLKTFVLHGNRLILAMSDFERGLRNAINVVFPTVHSTGCNTHFDRVSIVRLRNMICQQIFHPKKICNEMNGNYEMNKKYFTGFQAIYKKAKALGLSGLLRTNEEARTFFKKVLALAYLPARLIPDKFRDIRNNLSAPMTNHFSRFCAYFTRYWLGTVSPEGFSVYGLSRRTNNIIESYHSRLQHRMETRPGPWDFVCKFHIYTTAQRFDPRV